MEYKLYIEETEDTPVVNFDKESGILELSGRSLPEDASGFYSPIHSWIKEYILAPKEKTELILKLEYFNSSSAKQIMMILLTLSELKQQGKNILVVWYYSKNDELMEARGKELMILIDIPFDLRVF